MLKASLGIGILAMPLAFKNAGFATGVLGTGLVGALCIVTMHLLVSVKPSLDHWFSNASLFIDYYILLFI